MVDFVAVHPRIIGALRERVKGVGTGIFHGLVQVADHLGIDTIWGEATVNSAPFYEKVLGLDKVEDHFFIRGETLDHFRRQLKRLHAPET